MIVRFLFVIYCLLSLASCSETEIPSYTESSLYVFGDSLSDVGNANIASAGLIPDRNYFAGRFSNGPLYADQLAVILKTAMKPSRSYGSNYAFAGANSNVINAQVSNYKANVNDSADPDARYIIWSGANDLLDLVKTPVSDPTTTIDTAIAHIKNAIRKLSSINASQIFVINQINLAHLPRVIQLDTDLANSISLASQLSTQFNSALQTMLDSLNTEENIMTTSIDVFTLFEDVVANPENYNLTSVTDACYTRDESEFELTGNETICANPDEYLFWDSLHPTTIGHTILTSHINQSFSAN